MEYNEENKDQDISTDEFEENGTKQWLRDNLRIIVSVLIVVVIAGGIYSYSKRAEAPLVSQQDEQADIISQIAGTEDSKEGEAAKIEEKKEESPASQQAENNSKNQEVAKKEQETAKKEQVKPQASSIATSQETGSSFVESASRGDSKTTLARRALANHLEKNPDSTLTPEHKIYIEDYMRRRVANQGGVRIGASVEFQKTLIQEAITKSKTLNDSQLKNLHKYAVRVPALS